MPKLKKSFASQLLDEPIKFYPLYFSKLQTHYHYLKKTLKTTRKSSYLDKIFQTKLLYNLIKKCCLIYIF